MLVIAFANEKESLPAKVNIIISPVNDELPVIVNNTGAFVWRGGVYNINSSNLGNSSYFPIMIQSSIFVSQVV